jgi:hypothetical protein
MPSPLPPNYLALKAASAPPPAAQPETPLPNLGLLQLTLGPAAYRLLVEKWPHGQLEATAVFCAELPAYLIARCPFCQQANTEHLDTYSVQLWSRLYTEGRSVFDNQAIIHHCPHFVVVEPFVHFHGRWPDEARGIFGPEVPCVRTHLFPQRQALAVIHALSLCRLGGPAEAEYYLPSYTLFMVTYFAQDPGAARHAILEWSAEFYEEPWAPTPFLRGCAAADGGQDLARWVAAGRLQWVDGNDPGLGLRTGDPAAFPYQGITGRRFDHHFPYPLR